MIVRLVPQMAQNRRRSDQARDFGSTLKAEIRVR
jgi:hypothetical protein